MVGKKSVKAKRKTRETLLIVLGPILVIMGLIYFNIVSMSALSEFDLAISIGALVTILIFLIIDKRGR